MGHEEKSRPGRKYDIWSKKAEEGRLYLTTLGRVVGYQMKEDDEGVRSKKKIG